MPKIESKEFWNDLNWGRKHYSELIRKYPDKWIAIVNKKVVAAGESIKIIRANAIKKTGKKHIPLLFLEKGTNVY